METTPLRLLIPHRLYTVAKGDPTLLLIHISIKVNKLHPRSAWLQLYKVFWLQRGELIHEFVMLLRWICCPRSEPRDYPGAAARRCGGRGSGHARRSSHRSGNQLALLRLLIGPASLSVYLQLSVCALVSAVTRFQTKCVLCWTTSMRHDCDREDDLVNTF